MTDIFTIKQIKDAWNNYWPSRPPSKRTVIGLITELTRTQWKPQVGEVYVNGDREPRKNTGTLKPDEIFYEYCRPLTPDEVPAWKRDKEALNVAVEALEKICDGHVELGAFNFPCGKLAFWTLDKIKELTSE